MLTARGGSIHIHDFMEEKGTQKVHLKVDFGSDVFTALQVSSASFPQCPPSKIVDVDQGILRHVSSPHVKGFSKFRVSAVWTLDRDFPKVIGSDMIPSGICGSQAVR